MEKANEKKPSNQVVTFEDIPEPFTNGRKTVYKREKRFILATASLITSLFTVLATFGFGAISMHESLEAKELANDVRMKEIISLNHIKRLESNDIIEKSVSRN